MTNAVLNTINPNDNPMKKAFPSDHEKLLWFFSVEISVASGADVACIRFTAVTSHQASGTAFCFDGGSGKHLVTGRYAGTFRSGKLLAELGSDDKSALQRNEGLRSGSLACWAK